MGQLASSTLHRSVHMVQCPHCREEFDLFGAVWCGESNGEPSKICPECNRCACELPAYAEPHFWKDAPMAFQKQGFRRLFLYYL